MKVLLVFVPSREGKGGKLIPLGLLSIVNIFNDEGCDVKILDLFFDREMATFTSFIDKYKPDVVGYGGIATSYPMAKKVSEKIKRDFPNRDIVFIAGGPLASTYELLLNNKVVDYVIHGEAEISLHKLIRFIKGEGKDLKGIGGISYLKGSDIVRNNPERQIDVLDSIKLPAYHHIDLSLYTDPLKERYGIDELAMNNVLKEKVNHFVSMKNNAYLPLITSRGCTHRCTFCYRHVTGIRRYSVDYVIKHISNLLNKDRIGGFFFADELFNSDLQWVHDFCDALGSLNTNIFYIIAGARVNMIDKDLLLRLKATGCIEINYGHESGSSEILKYYQKGISVEGNISATILSKEAGLFTPIQLVIGSPPETTRTIYETVDFLKAVSATSASINYIIPLPETPIWKYVIEKGIVTDVEKYLERIRKYGGTHKLGVNLTNSNKIVWLFWKVLLLRAVMLNRSKLKKQYFRYVLGFLFLGVLIEAAWNVFKRKIKRS